MADKIVGHQLKSGGGITICINCGESTRLMRIYRNDKNEDYVRCGLCDENLQEEVNDEDEDDDFDEGDEDEE